MLDEPLRCRPIGREDIQHTFGLKSADRHSITDHNVHETLNITDRAYLLLRDASFKGKYPEELAANKIVKEKYLGTDCSSEEGRLDQRKRAQKRRMVYKRNISSFDRLY